MDDGCEGEESGRVREEEPIGGMKERKRGKNAPARHRQVALVREGNRVDAACVVGIHVHTDIKSAVAR
jgi:hypothetical protein